MNLFTDSFYRKIQRIIAVIMMVLSILGLIFNFLNFALTTVTVINLGLLVFALCFSICTLIFYNKRIRFMQVVLFFLVGVISLIAGDRFRYVGDILITFGVILGYTYDVFDSRSYIPALIAAVLLMVLRILVGVFLFAATMLEDTIISTMFSCLLLLIVAVLQSELLFHITEAKKNELYVRAGYDFIGLASTLKPGDLKALIERCKTKQEHKDWEGLEKFLNLLDNAVNTFDKMTTKVLNAVSTNRLYRRSIVDIHKILQEVVDFLSLPMPVQLNVKMELVLFDTVLKIHAIPNEIFLIFQNIISNAINAVLATNTPGRVKIQTKLVDSRIVIKVSDTGKGFPLTKNNKVALPGRAEDGKGTGLYYVTAIIRYYNGKIQFYNRESAGAEVIISFPEKEVTSADEVFL